MNLILFAHQDSFNKGATFKRVMDQNFNKIEIQTFQTFNAFKARLKQVSIYDREIYVLLADSKNRLKELTSLIDLLEGKRIILILPDDSKVSLFMAHQFFPRFFTYINDTYDDLCAVLIKMINQKKIYINLHDKGGH